MKLSRVLAVVAFSVLAAVGCQTTDDAVSEQVEVDHYTIQDFLETTNMFGSSFSPDGSKLLVSRDETGIYNAYAIPVAGGPALQLTQSADDAVRVAGYFRDDERFLYSQDRGGDELHHLYVRELDGSSTDLTPGEDLKALFLGWADDDRSFFVGTNQRDDRYFDIFEVDPTTYESTLVFQDETGYQVSAISPDKQRVVFSKPNTRLDNDLYMYDRAVGEMTHLTPHDGEISYSAQFFSPDGGSLYLTTDEGQEYKYLMRMDLASGDRELVMRPDWDVMFAYLSDTDAYMVVGVNEDARTVMNVHRYPSMEEVELPAIAGLDVTSVSFSPDDSRIAFYASSSTSPRNLYVREIGEGDAAQLTENLNPGIDSEHLVQGEVVRFTSFDGVEIPGVLYEPHGASPENKVPALVWVHGGPGGQSRLGYSELIQYLVNHGYAIYAINNRGSSGYGKTFFSLDDRRHGQDDLDDCVASKNMLIDTGWVDSERIGIIGGSYGGYMVLAALAFRPEEFAAGVDLFGISNWVRTLESIPPWWEAARQSLYDELGDPATDREMLEAKSPLFHSSNIVRPLMVMQGANDPRVIQPESDDIVEAVRANGVPVEYVLFDDEGHGFSKKENREEGWQAVLRFVDEHVKGEPAEDLEAVPTSD
jgi:dipeptidyl aminopeptidase/acylaminoacyl peptidase